MNQVKKFRQAKKMTQKELADKVNVTRQTVYLIETNKYNPTLSLCLKLCNVLETDLNQLFGRKEWRNEL